MFVNHNISTSTQMILQCLHSSSFLKVITSKIKLSMVNCYICPASTSCTICPTVLPPASCVLCDVIIILSCGVESISFSCGRSGPSTRSPAAIWPCQCGWWSSGSSWWWWLLRWGQRWGWRSTGAADIVTSTLTKYDDDEAILPKCFLQMSVSCDLGKEWGIVLLWRCNNTLSNISICN